jgi:hypothetical protein
MSEEPPKYILTIVATRGMISRAAPTPTANKVRDLRIGTPLACYEVTVMMDGVSYARLSPLGAKTAEWVRVAERDESIVYAVAREIVTEQDKIANALNRVADAIADLKK